MKIVKIIFGTLAALWALAVLFELFTKAPQWTGSLAFSKWMGAITGILLPSAISITLFRSAFKKVQD